MTDHRYNPKHKHCTSCQEWAEMHQTETSSIEAMHKPTYNQEVWL